MPNAPRRVLVRTGDSVAIHHIVDARDVLAGNPAASIYEGPTVIRSKGQLATVPASVAIELVDSPAANAQLIAELPPEE
jgi:hypothetical protein